MKGKTDQAADKPVISKNAREKGHCTYTVSILMLILSYMFVFVVRMLPELVKLTVGVVTSTFYVIANSFIFLYGEWNQYSSYWEYT